MRPTNAFLCAAFLLATLGGGLPCLQAEESYKKRRATIALQLLGEASDLLDRWASSPTDPTATQEHISEACALLSVSQRIAEESGHTNDPQLLAASRNLLHSADRLAQVIRRIVEPDRAGDGRWEQELLNAGIAFDNSRRDLPAWSPGVDDWLYDRGFREAVEEVGRLAAGQDTCRPERTQSAQLYAQKKAAWASRLEAKARQREAEAAQRAADAEEYRRKARASLPPDIDAIKAWHERSYWPKMAAFKLALRRTGMLDRKRPNAALKGACSDIHSATGALRADSQLRSGSAVVDASLSAMLETFEAAATACLQGNFKSFDQGYQQGERQLGELAAVFARYKLQP